MREPDRIDLTAAQLLICRLVHHFERIDQALVAPDGDATVYQRELRILRDELASFDLVPARLALPAPAPAAAFALPQNWEEAVRRLEQAKIDVAVSTYVPTEEAFEAFLHSGGPNPWAEYRKLLAQQDGGAAPAVLVQQVVARPDAALGAVDVAATPPPEPPAPPAGQGDHYR